MLIDKTKLPLVAMEFMNEVHLEDVDIINELFEQILLYEKDTTQQNEQILNKLYEKWYNHTVEHFKGEEEMMLQKQFPPYPVHKSEHQYALNKMTEIFQNWKQNKDIKSLKRYIQIDLIQWLINHIQTMDTVTANFFKTGFSPCSAQH